MLWNASPPYNSLTLAPKCTAFPLVIVHVIILSLRVVACCITETNGIEEKGQTS